jgi:hypothetical protein
LPFLLVHSTMPCIHILNQNKLHAQVENAEWMQQVSPYGDRYVYTTNAFLLSLFLDCPPGMGLSCPGPFTRAKVLKGIKSGALAVSSVVVAHQLHRGRQLLHSD